MSQIRASRAQATAGMGTQRTRRWQLLWVAIAAALAFPTPVAAQSLLLNNYGRVPIGQAGALEGGAFIARADDAGGIAGGGECPNTQNRGQDHSL